MAGRPQGGESLRQKKERPQRRPDEALDGPKGSERRIAPDGAEPDLAVSFQEVSSFRQNSAVNPKLSCVRV
jgi:hypothetical protein